MISLEFKQDYRNSPKLFRTDLFSKCFRDLFESSYEDSIALEKGPLRIILDDYLLIPGKGGSKEKLKEWPDVTYFTHVLNGIVISGKTLEKMYFLRETDSFQDSEKYVRLFFASLALHDSDKLFQEGEFGANNLDKVLEKNKHEIVKILSYYLGSLGSPIDWWNDLVFLILRNENRSYNYANSIKTKLDRSQLETISKFVKLGDQTGGIKASLSRTIYSEMKKFLYPYLETLGESINLIQFSDLPQTLLLDKLYLNFQRFLNESDRDVVAYFPDAIVYTGQELDKSEYENVRNNFADEMEPNKDNIDMILENFAPSGNSIRLYFSRNVRPSKTIIETYIEKFKGRLLIWQGEEWKKANRGFDATVRSFGIPLSSTVKNGKLAFHLDVPEISDEESDVDTQKKRYLSLISCGQRVLYTSKKNDEFDTSKEHNFAVKIFGEKIFDMADSLQTRTIESISYACLFSSKGLEELKFEYGKICEEISENLKSNFDKSNAINYEDFFNRALRKELLIQEPPDKADMCIYCGVFTKNPLKEENAFGIKPTAGTGKKITVLKYDENKFNGKICGYCIKENELRSSKKIGKLKEALCAHIYLGDYYVPVNPDQIVESLKDALNDRSNFAFDNAVTLTGKEKVVFRIGKKSEIDLGYHMVAMISKPGNKAKNKNKVDEFYRLKSTLDFIIKTGMKVRLTPLISSKRIFYPMFEWDNAPSWVVNLEMDKVRIDRLNVVKRELELIFNVSTIDRSQSSLSKVIIETNRSKRGIFSILWRYLSKESNHIDLRKYPKTMEGVEWYMDEFKKELNRERMNKVVDEACGISMKGPKSNNDNTWMLRESMKLYIKYLNHDDEDLKEKIAGTIWIYASRQSEYTGKEAKEHCVGFAEAFVGLMRTEFKNKMPANDRRKDLIYQFALMYNIEKWRRISKKKKEGEEND